jgi:hypothetical protein
MCAASTGSARRRSTTGRAKYLGLEVSEAERLMALKSENTTLKKLLADAVLDNAALKDLLTKIGDVRCQARGRGSLKERPWEERAADVPGDRLPAHDGALCRPDDPRLRDRLVALARGKSKLRLLPPADLPVPRGLRGEPQAAVHLCREDPNDLWALGFVSDQLVGGRRFRMSACARSS